MAETAIQDRSKTKLVQLKRHLAISDDDTTFNTLLLDMLAEAKSLADAYCSNPFTDADGEEEDIPRHVETWIKATVARWFRIRENGVVGESVSGVGSSAYGPVDYTGLFQGWKPFI